MEKENVKLTVVKEGYRSLARETKSLAHGGRVLLFTTETRAGDDAQAALTFEGMQVCRRNLPENLSDDLFSELQRAPEGIMAAVGVGGAVPIEAVKAAHIPVAIPKILFPTEFSALSASDERVFLSTKSDLPSTRSTGQIVLFDPHIVCASPLRPGLGYLLARFVEEADGAFERLLLTGENPAAALRSLKEKNSALTSLREENPAEDLVDAALSLLKTQETPLSNSAHVLAVLAAKRTGGVFSDYLFPAAYALLRLYAGYLSSLPLEHCPPPDRAENLRLLGAKCGLSPSLLHRKQGFYAEDYDKRWRLTAEYREDFSEAVGEKAIPLSALSRLYRRTPEQGSSPRLSASDLLMLLSLTGEAVSGYPLIKHIKMTGLIEPLLRCG